MSRPRKLVALVLLAVLGALGVSVADAATGHRRSSAGLLPKRFPLGTQTLCCRTSTSSTSRASAPAAKASSHDSPILVILVGVAGFMLGGLVVAEAIGLRARRARRTPTAAERPRPPRPPRDPTAIGATDALELAIGLHRNGDRAAAAAAYRRAELAGQPMAAFNLGVLLYESAELDGAEQAWRRCLDHPESRAVAATNLGFLLEKRGDLRGARNFYLAAARWGDPTAQTMAERLGVGARH